MVGRYTPFAGVVIAAALQRAAVQGADSVATKSAETHRRDIDDRWRSIGLGAPMRGADNLGAGDLMGRVAMIQTMRKKAKTILLVMCAGLSREILKLCSI